MATPLSLEDKLAVALHNFAAVTAEDFVSFDYFTDRTVSVVTGRDSVSTTTTNSGHAWCEPGRTTSNLESRRWT